METDTLKLISVNIEGDNHLDRVLAFLQKEDPDVVCLQEVFKDDLHLFEAHFGQPAIFAPHGEVKQENKNRLSVRGLWGVAILSKLPIVSSQIQYFVKHTEEVAEILPTEPNSVDRALICVDIRKAVKTYRVATTHFTWTAAGAVTDEQRKDLQSLLGITKNFGEHVLCGDFNAPRGKEIFDTLATIYTDNIPKEVTTSIDQNLHRVTGIQFMVDGLFTTSGYAASDVRVVDAVSDHCAVIGLISRTE
jgi:endonuclease/exonuclease/phosphatase family metal-dependent hydrolase